jgi:succinate dehydrogenase flavin-adding protein (antitoxin of CptAB toxin-antitoxin module)
MYIDEFMSYWCEWFDQRHYSFPIQPINLTDRTRHLDVEALPVRYRPVLIEFLQACVEHDIFKKYPDRTRVLFNFINSTIEELKIMPESQEQWLKFLSHNAYFDKKTDQSFAMLNKRLYNLLDAPDKELIDIMTNDINIEKQFSQEITHKVAFFKKLDVQS